MDPCDAANYNASWGPEVAGGPAIDSFLQSVSTFSCSLS